MKYPVKISWKTEILPLLILAAAAGMGGYFYAHFPDKVAVHWNFAGGVDRYGSRAEGAWAIPGMLMAMYVMFLVLPLLDPKRDRYVEFEKYYRLFRLAILFLMLVIFAASGLFNLGYPVRIEDVVPISIGLMFIVMGNFMGKIKNNWFMGIRTPWTLSSENVWNKTHRMGGWLFAIYGLIIMVSPHLPQVWGMGLFMAGAVMMVLGTTAYSYWLYKKER
jgi:uncharacterized membrane protein